MPAHHFKIGSKVTLSFAEGKSLAKPSSYVVEAQMPPVGTSLQYRIKSEAEGFSRVVVEHQLVSIDALPTVDATTPIGPHSGEED